MPRRTRLGAEPKDRRVRRTRDRLRHAMIDLVARQGYADTRLEELLAHADVGRSTFYAHYRDKDALFASALAGLEAELRRAPDRGPLSFTRPMLEHVATYAGGRAHTHLDPTLLTQVRRMLLRLAVEDLTRRARIDVTTPVELLAEHAIGSFLAVMTAWVRAPRGRDAASVDALYRDLVLPGLARALAG
jgi:AcrR family transcriptional regulator